MKKTAVLFAGLALFGCSETMTPSLPGKQDLLSDIEGTRISNQVGGWWSFEEDSEYISFEISDQATFDDEAFVHIDAIGRHDNGRSCVNMKLKVNYKLDDSNTWRRIGPPEFQNDWRDIRRYSLDEPECQPS